MNKLADIVWNIFMGLFFVIGCCVLLWFLGLLFLVIASVFNLSILVAYLLLPVFLGGLYYIGKKL